jgi:hypothetical protein
MRMRSRSIPGGRERANKSLTRYDDLVFVSDGVAAL